MNQLRIITGTICCTLLFFGMVIWSSCDKSKTKYNNTTLIRPCDNVICLNGGSCKDGLCYCPQVFEGDKCQTRWSDKFIGNYTASDECYTGADIYYDVQVAAVADFAYKLKFYNLGTFCPTTPINANINLEKTSFSIPLQNSCGNLYLSGSGNISGNFINVYLTARDSNAHTSSACSIVLSRK